MKKLLILVLALFALATMVALPFLPLTAEAPLVHAMAKDAVAVVRDAYPRAIKYGPPIVLVEDPAMSPLESSSPIFPKTTYQEDKAAYLRRIESGLNAMIFLGCLVVAAQVAIWFWWRSFIVKIELPRSMASVAPPNAPATNPGKRGRTKKPVAPSAKKAGRPKAGAVPQGVGSVG